MNDQQLLHEKVNQAAQVLEELGIDAWLTFVRETSLHRDPALDLILGLDLTWQSALILSRTGRHTAIVGFYDSENVRNTGLYPTVVGYHQGIGEHLRAVLDDLQPAQIAINYSESDVAADGLTFGLYRILQSHLNGTPYGDRLISAEQIIGAVRGRKSRAEVERVRRAIIETEQLFEEVEEYARPGMTQRQIADFVHGRIEVKELGYAWEKQYCPIVTCGPDSAVGHTAPGDVPLKKGHTLHMDLGVKVDSYCSDLQRMWYVLDEGETEAPAEVQRAFDTVRGAIEAGRAALRPGVRGWQVDAPARQLVVDAGYSEYMHALGHLLGRNAHDGATVLGPRWEKYAGICELPVEAGNIFTLELHVTIPERGMMSLEEDVLVTENGVEYLSRPQTALRFIQG